MMAQLVLSRKVSTGVKKTYSQKNTTKYTFLVKTLFQKISLRYMNKLLMTLVHILRRMRKKQKDNRPHIHVGLLHGFDVTWTIHLTWTFSSGDQKLLV